MFWGLLGLSTGVADGVGLHFLVGFLGIPRRVVVWVNLPVVLWFGGGLI